METVKKRILWFTHNDCGYDKIIRNNDKLIHTGTWTEAILNSFKKQDDFELAVAFRSKNNHKVLKKDGVVYFPVSIRVGKTKFSRVLKKSKHKIPWYDEIDDYLSIVEIFKPDLIHVFGTEENFGFITNHIKVPLVLSIQGNLTVYNWKYFSGLSNWQLFSVIDFKKFVRFSSSYSFYMLFKKMALREQEILKNIRYIIGRTDWDRRITRILSPNSKYFYNDEVLRDQFYKEPIVMPSVGEELIISTMSGPAVYKGLETVCMTVSLLNDLGVNFTWNIGGVSVKDNLVLSIKRKLKNKFPKKNINFMGKLSEMEIINLLKGTNIYVLPSHIENSPLTLSEAMILGLPIVCALAGGTSSRLTDKKEGLLIQDGDPWSLAGAILELKDNYKQALVYGKNARKRALTRHDPNVIISDLKNIYYNILKKK